MHLDMILATCLVVFFSSYLANVNDEAPNHSHYSNLAYAFFKVFIYAQVR